MDLTPLFAEPLATQLHGLGALAALVFGTVQLAGRKGSNLHRLFGYTWVGLMIFIALTSFAIHGKRQWGPFSVIHLLSLLVLVLTPLAVLAARRHHVRTHSRAMMALFVGALIVAGGFTLLPGRVMHEVFFPP